MSKKTEYRRKTALYKAPYCILIVLVMLFIVGISPVSALDWDNVKEYDAITKTVTIDNALGLGDTISTIRLDSPLANQVGVGYVRVAEFTINQVDDSYAEALKKIDFYNIKDDMKSTPIEFDYKYKVTTIDSGINKICSIDNKTLIKTCEDIPYEREVVEWKDYDYSITYKGEITIGVYTTTTQGQHVEWIPTFYGVKINEWATWDASLDVGLVNYYNFDEGSGTAVADSLGNNDITLTGDIFNATGKLGSKLTFDASNTGIQANNMSASLLGGLDRSFNFWASYGDVATTTFLWSYGDVTGSNSAISFGHTGANFYIEYFAASTTTGGVKVGGDMKMYTAIYTNATGTVTFYVNGVLNATDTLNVLRTKISPLRLGGRFDDTQKIDAGSSLDELGIWNRTLSTAEITQLYNGGTGITYSVLVPTVDLLVPANNTASATTIDDFSFNITYNSADWNNFTFYIWNATNGAEKVKRAVVNGTPDTNCTVGSSGSGWSIINCTGQGISDDGNYEWNSYTCNSGDHCAYATNNFTFSVDTTIPVINLYSPIGKEDYFKIGNDETLNWSITELNLDSAWYEYNSTNTTIYGLVNNTNFTIETGDYELTLWANDTLGNLASNTSAWSYKVVENSQTYSNTTLEGNSETFLLNVTLNSSYVIDSANLNYNNTNYTATIGTNNLTATITIPSVASATNQTFYWIFILNEGSQIETNSLNQTVNNFGVDNCTTYTYQFLNMTMFDEDTQVMLNNTTQNTSIQVDFSISTSDNSLVVLNYSSDYYQTNPARICFESPLNSSVYRVDGVIQYDSVNRFQEFYNFQNYILNNATDNFTVGLYNLNDSNGEEFTITYKDANFVPVSNALVNIQRKYIDEGLFKTIEIPKTSASGTTIAHLITNDIIYNILVFKEGELLATFESVIADCQNPSLYSCEINLNSYGSSTMPTDFTEADDLTFTLEYNTNTREISSVFAIPSGVASEINLTVVLFDGLGNTSVCSDSLTSAGGGVSCAVPLSFGNSTVIATIHKDSNYIGRSIIRSKQNPSDIYGSSIIFIAMILFLLFLGIGASSDSPMLMGIIIILGTIVLIALNLVYSPSFIGVGATILWLVIAIVTVLVKGSNR